MPNFKAFFFFLISIFLVFDNSVAQEEKKVVQIGGLIVTGDSAYGVPGVHIYVEGSGRGTTSNQYGFFSFPTLIGDTLTISAVSYKKSKYVVPEVASLNSKSNRHYSSSISQWVTKSTEGGDYKLILG